MFEDIISEPFVVEPTPTAPTPKTPKPPKIPFLSEPKKDFPVTAFEMVKQTDDLRMLTKILDLCKVKVRKQKRKQRQRR